MPPGVQSVENRNVLFGVLNLKSNYFESFHFESVEKIRSISTTLSTGKYWPIRFKAEDTCRSRSDGILTKPEGQARKLCRHHRTQIEPVAAELKTSALDKQRAASLVLQISPAVEKE